MTFTFTGSDDLSVHHFVCSLDGATPAICSSPTTYNLLSKATHNVSVRAVDGAGNADLTPSLWKWKVTK